VIKKLLTVVRKLSDNAVDTDWLQTTTSKNCQ